MGLNIQFVISAEFDIDKGPNIVHQYPTSIPGFEHGTLPFLPELMLPDQIHTREEDYTLFLLYKNLKTGLFQYVYDKNMCDENPYFLYTIVNNKSDSTVKRGAVIKSLSIITKLKFFPSFKPLLLIALDNYFESSNTSVLRQLYDSVNIKNLLFSNSNKSISLIRKLLITSILDLPINDTIYKDEYFRNKLLGLSNDQEKSSNNINGSQQSYNSSETNGKNTNNVNGSNNTNGNNNNNGLFIRKDLSFNSVVNFLNFNIPIKIPLIDLPDTIGDYLNPTDINFKPNLMNILVASLATEVKNDDLTIYGLQTPPIIILINALLTGKKIIFLGYEKSASYIIDHILLTLKIITGGGILSGFLTNFNVFPMIDVSKIDILEQCESFLAGTINPFFKNNDAWWDVLYDLDTNEFFISKTRSHQHGGAQDFVSFSNSFQVPIISEDAKFLSNLQHSIYNYHDDLTTIQLIFRRHINEIIRILISLKNFNSANFLPISSNNGPSLEENIQKSTLLLDGIGYYWSSDTTKLLEMSCYQSISKKFQDMLYSGKLIYNLSLPNLSNELNLMIDLQYHLQSLISSTTKLNEREIWFNILKYLISGQSLETFLLVTYLIPPLSSSSSASNSTGNVTTIDKNKGFELLLINLFNKDDRVKSNIVMILQELQDNHLCGWCLSNFIKSNVIYEIAYNDLVNDV